MIKHTDLRQAEALEKIEQHLAKLVAHLCPQPKASASEPEVPAQDGADAS
jgi:uncharacterized membrane protein